MNLHPGTKRGGGGGIIRRYNYQNHHGVVQRPVGVHRLHIAIDDVVPLRAQVNEAPGPHLLAFPVEDVVSRRLVLDRCNKSVAMSHRQSWKKIKSTALSLQNDSVRKNRLCCRWFMQPLHGQGLSKKKDASTLWSLDLFSRISDALKPVIKCNLRHKRLCLSAALEQIFFLTEISTTPSGWRFSFTVLFTALLKAPNWVSFNFPLKLSHFCFKVC